MTDRTDTTAAATLLADEIERTEREDVNAFYEAKLMSVRFMQANGFSDDKIERMLGPSFASRGSATMSQDTNAACPDCGCTNGWHLGECLCRFYTEAELEAMREQARQEKLAAKEALARQVQKL